MVLWGIACIAEHECDLYVHCKSILTTASNPENYMHICTVQAWNTLLCAAVAFPTAFFFFIHSSQNLGRIILSFETATRQKDAITSRDQTVLKVLKSQKWNVISKVSWKIPVLHRAWVKCHLLALHAAWDRLNETSASSVRVWCNMASDTAINWPRSVEGTLCSCWVQVGWAEL